MKQLPLVMLATFFALNLFSPAAAQNQGGQNVQVDCTAFRKEADGSWTALRQTNIMIGTNSISTSAGKIQGTVNGVRVLDAIDQKCGSAVSPRQPPSSAVGRSGWLMSWKSNDMALADCTARARELVKNFPFTDVNGQTVVAWYEGYTVMIRCITEKKIVVFVEVTPPIHDAETDRSVQGLVDQIAAGF